MPNILFPRHGSMQVWPRKRAKRIYARVRYQAVKDAKPAGFPAYKVRMVQVLVMDNSPNSMTKNEEIIVPATILEAPPIRIFSVRFYKKSDEDGSLKVADEVLVSDYKELNRKVNLGKAKKDLSSFKDKLSDYSDITILVHTQPKLAGVSKKKPEIVELHLGGSLEDKFKYASEHVGKDIPVSEVLSESSFVDAHAVTKGHGFQGAIKRFGIALKSHKAQKGQRGVANLGPWEGQGHVMYRVAHAGQMGFHQRTEFNKYVLKIGSAKEFNRKEGFEHYGVLKSDVIILYGSIPGPSKRMIQLMNASRPPKRKVSLQFLRIV